MPTPLDLRNRKREAQRAVRLALNAFNSSLDSWKAAVGGGKRHATQLSNAVLTYLHLPALPLGVLAGVPGVQQAALARLGEQQQEALGSLGLCMVQLDAAVESMGAALAALQQVVEAEEAAPLLTGGPIFAALPLPTIWHMLEEVEGMHRRELGVKHALLEGFSEAVGALEPPRQLHQVQGGSSSSTAGGRSAGGVTAAAELEARLRSSMEVYITAWMLSPEVDDARVQAHIGLLTEDMSGF